LAACFSQSVLSVPLTADLATTAGTPCVSNIWTCTGTGRELLKAESLGDISFVCLEFSRPCCLTRETCNDDDMSAKLDPTLQGAENARS